MKNKPRKGRLWLYFRTGPDVRRGDRGWRELWFYFGVFKDIPPQGVRISRSHFTGIMISFAYWLPFEKI